MTKLKQNHQEELFPKSGSYSTTKIPSRPKPFLKWAGGKGQLINDIEKSLPEDIEQFDTYVEPFVGSGAVLFWILNTYKHFKCIVINDINKDIVKAYTTIRDNPTELIDSLQDIQTEYNSIDDVEKQRDYFLNKRTLFNERTHDDIKNTTLLIFLNRTCYNGLYRVNSSNKFNVPFGKYSNPKICDKETILSDSKVLQDVEILNGDFEETKKYATKSTFFYFDPPYKPISKTSSFVSYASDTFDDDSQERLSKFCIFIDSIGSSWLLSNSDLKNVEIENNYFDELYKDYNIKRIDAKRNINSVGSKRGIIKELLISNY